MCSHTIPHYHLYWTGAGREHHQQGLCDHYWNQSHPDRKAVAGPAGWEEGLWGWVSGELWVPWFRCRGDEKGWGEGGGEAFRVSVIIMHSLYTHTHAREHAEKYTHVAVFLSLPAAWPWWGHSWELLAGWWAVCCCANQRGQIYICLQVLAGQRSRRWVDC